MLMTATGRVTPPVGSSTPTARSAMGWATRSESGSGDSDRPIGPAPPPAGEGDADRSEDEGRREEEDQAPVDSRSPGGFVEDPSADSRRDRDLGQNSLQESRVAAHPRREYPARWARGEVRLSSAASCAPRVSWTCRAASKRNVSWSAITVHQPRRGAREAGPAPD